MSESCPQRRPREGRQRRSLRQRTLLNPEQPLRGVSEVQLDPDKKTTPPPPETPCGSAHWAAAGYTAQAETKPLWKSGDNGDGADLRDRTVPAMISWVLPKRSAIAHGAGGNKRRLALLKVLDYVIAEQGAN